ncbi:MAG: LacI family transcriptional regulator, partial [Clostridia bacterium]|nr:LacI family transcriptional regulator [Clostridia bacterium]
MMNDKNSSKDKKITIRDIAAETGLSLNTISKVLNKKLYYSKETEQRVMKAVEKLGYVPNTIASSLRAGHSKTVAIVFDDLINPFYSVMTLSIARALAQSRYDVMMFSNYGASSFLDHVLFNKIVSRKIDAVVSFLEPQPELTDSIVNSRIPFLLVGRTANDGRIDSLYSDDVAGGKIATDHLIERGYKQIAYIGAHPEISADKHRFTGYCQSLEANAIPYRPEYVAYFSDFQTFEALALWLMKLPVDAVFCFNDCFSFSIINELRKLGKKVPRDFAWVGYDNIQRALALPLNLTSVSIDTDYMGRKTVEVLLKKIAHDETYRESLRTPLKVT